MYIMNRIVGVFLLVGIMLPAVAQRLLSLDSCRALAIRNNKELNISKLKCDVASNNRKAAHTKYLPSIDATGTYMRTSKEISILNDEQKATLQSMGTSVSTKMATDMTPWITEMAQSLARDGVDVVRVTVSTDGAATGGTLGQSAGRQSGYEPATPRNGNAPSSWSYPGDTQPQNTPTTPRGAPRTGSLDLYA